MTQEDVLLVVQALHNIDFSLGCLCLLAGIRLILNKKLGDVGVTVLNVLLWTLRIVTFPIRLLILILLVIVGIMATIMRIVACPDDIPALIRDIKRINWITGVKFALGLDWL